MTIKRILCGLYQANAYLVYNQGDEALLIDAGDDFAGIMRAIEMSGKRLHAIVLTHGHFDHTLAAGRLREATGAKVLIGQDDAAYLSDARLNMYDRAASSLAFEPIQADELLLGGALTLAGISLDVIMTPGHTPGGLSVMLKDERALFTGDTLFAQGYGRLDLPGGEARAMRESLRKLLALPGGLTVYAGHGEVAQMSAIKEAWAI